MELLVVRHAIAESRQEFAKTGRDDARRPLTAEGRRKFEQGARGLHALAPGIELLATSSLDRATQTAELIQQAWGGELRAVTIDELAPDADPDALLRWLRGQKRRELVAVVGHEPHLSRLVERAVTGETPPDRSRRFELKKGGACLLALGKAPKAGSARLRWLLTQAQLRRLAR